MQTVHEVAELRARVALWKQQGLKVALVPTMGNLHDGHIALVADARQRADRVVVSVFVNPTQFGPNEDFDRYPRTLAQDAARLAEGGADLLFAPDVASIYPGGAGRFTKVSVPGVTEVLEGAHRPGHFDGVSTVVTLLFNLVQPDLAIFGEKDYQQLQVIRRMVRDLHLPVEIVGHPIERAADGLALSSRNQYLSAEERTLAPRLQQQLAVVGQRLRGGERDFDRICAEASAALDAIGFRTQYLRICSPALEAPSAEAKSFVILVAASLGTTRLIDNLQVPSD